MPAESSVVTRAYEQVFVDQLVSKRASASPEMRESFLPHDALELRRVLRRLIGRRRVTILIDDADERTLDDEFVQAVLTNRPPVSTYLIMVVRPTADVFKRLRQESRRVLVPWSVVVLPPLRVVPSREALLTIPGLVSIEAAKKLGATRSLDRILRHPYYQDISGTNGRLDEPAPQAISALLYAVGEIPVPELSNAAMVLEGTSNELERWLMQMPHITSIGDRWMFLDGWRPYALRQQHRQQMDDGLAAVVSRVGLLAVTQKHVLQPLWIRQVAPSADPDLERAFRELWACGRKVRFGWKHPVARKERIEALLRALKRFPSRETPERAALLIRAARELGSPALLRRAAKMIATCPEGGLDFPDVIAELHAAATELDCSSLAARLDSLRRGKRKHTRRSSRRILIPPKVPDIVIEATDSNVVVGATITDAYLMAGRQRMDQLRRERPRLYDVISAGAALYQRRRATRDFREIVAAIMLAVLYEGENSDRRKLARLFSRLRRSGGQLFPRSGAAKRQISVFEQAVNRIRQAQPTIVGRD